MVDQSTNVESSSSKRSSNSGFYAHFNTSKNISTPSKPSFLNESKVLDNTSSVLSNNKKVTLIPSKTIFSDSPKSINKVKSAFGSAKRKRPSEIVSKPSFKVSHLVGAVPHLPKFGTSLTKVKFNFSTSESNFYTGKTKFGGSSSMRHDQTFSNSNKRVKLSPVSYRGPSNVTRVSVKPYNVESNRSLLTSKTADNILQTLNNICTPVAADINNKSWSTSTIKRPSFHSEFSSFSQRLREKRKFGMASLPPPPISRLNQIKAKVIESRNRDEKSDHELFIKENEKKYSEGETKLTVFPTKINVESSANPFTKFLSSPKSDEKTISSPSVLETAKDFRKNSNESNKLAEKVEIPLSARNDIVEIVPIQNELQTVKSISSKNTGLKMKRERTKDHYTAASEQVEEPVNTLPEITHPQPLILTTLPKFDFTVKPASSSLFSNVSKLPKPAAVVLNKSNNNSKFDFSTPKLISDRDVTSPTTQDRNYSFVSPVCVKSMTSPVKKSKLSNCKSSETNSKLVAPSAVVHKSCVKEVKEGSEATSASNAPLFSFGLPKVFTTTTSAGFSFGKTSPSQTTFSVASTDTVSLTGFTFSKPFSIICSSGKSFAKTSDSSKSFSFALPISKTSETTTIVECKNKIQRKASSLGGVPSISTTQEVKRNPFAKLKPAEGNWECPTCMISNKSDVLKCVACAELKPGSAVEDNTFVASTASTNSNFKFGSSGSNPDFKFGSTGSNPDFKFGSTGSNSDFKFGADTKSEMFKSNRSSVGISSSSTVTSVTSTPSTGNKIDKLKKDNPFAKLKPAEGSWECPTCMISNNPDVLKCVACAEAKPGLPPSVDTTKPPTNTLFSFGSSKPEDTAPSSNEFSFSAKQENKANTLLSASLSNNLFSFGGATSAEKSPAGFTFGATSSAVNSGFSFNSTTASSAGSINGFSTTSTASTTTKVENAPSNGFTFENSNGICSSSGSSNVGFTFGKGGDENTQVKATSGIFGAKTEMNVIQEPAAVQSGFAFGPSNVSSKWKASSGFTFGSSAASAEPKPTFGFGAMGGSEEPKTRSSFGASTNTVEPAPVSDFGFGALSNDSVTKGFNFGAVPTSEQKAPAFGFGTSSNVESTLGSGFNFGTTTTNTGFNFGGSSNSVEKTAATESIFGATTSFVAPKMNGFPPPMSTNSTNSSVPQFNFMANSNKPPSFFDKPKPAVGPASMSTPNINFGAVTNAGTLFGNPNPSGQFSFSSNNNGNGGSAPKPNTFAPPAPTANLFSIGGGGGSKMTNDATGGERRKVKRAHRRLPRK